MTRQHEPSHLDIENPIYDGKRPHLWIQWKGTDVCCDIHCKCGAHLHFDGDFLYFFQCPHCKTYWECGTHMPIYEVSAARAGEHVVKQPEPDENWPDVTPLRAEQPS